MVSEGDEPEVGDTVRLVVLVDDRRSRGLVLIVVDGLSRGDLLLGRLDRSTDNLLASLVKGSVSLRELREESEEREIRSQIRSGPVDE